MVSHEAILGERKSLISDFHRVSPKMATLRFAELQMNRLKPKIDV